MLREIQRIARHGKGAPRKRLVVCFLHVILWPILVVPRLFWARPRRGPISRILLVRVDGIGDLGMTCAIFPSLRKRYPDASIDLITSDVARQTAELLVAAKWIDSLRVLPLLGRNFGTYRQLWRELRAIRYDAAVDLRGDMRNVLLFWAAGIPRRIGLFDGGFSYLLTDVIDVAPGSHQSVESTELVRRLGVEEFEPWPRLPLRSQDIADADRWLAEQGIAVDRPVCAFHLGAFLELKVWPLERFVAVARELSRKFDARLVVVGGGSEAELAVKFAEQVGTRVAIATGKTPVVLTAAILSRCAVFVGNDSGPAHLAACVGCPVVVLFGPAEPSRYHPLSPRIVVMRPHGPCDPGCDKTCARPATRCMLDHTVEAVTEAAEKFVRQSWPDQVTRVSDHPG